MAERFDAYLDPAARAANDQDLALVLGTGQSLQSILARYRTDADFRPRINAILEMLPQAAQSQFVDTLRGSTTP